MSASDHARGLLPIVDQPGEWQPLVDAAERRFGAPVTFSALYGDKTQDRMTLYFEARREEGRVAPHMCETVRHAAGWVVARNGRAPSVTEYEVKDSECDVTTLSIPQRGPYGIVDTGRDRVWLMGEGWYEWVTYSIMSTRPRVRRLLQVYGGGSC